MFRNSPPDVNRDIAMEAMSESTAIVSDGDGTSLLAFPSSCFIRCSAWSISTVRSGLEMPPISECRADIPMLASHFLRKLRYIRVTSGFSTEAQRIIQAYRWQGNVRELQNAVQHALLFGDSAVIQPEDLPEYVLNSKTTENSKANSYQAQVTAFKRSLVKTALSDARGNHAEAASSLDVSPSYFRRLARDLNITL